MSESIDVNTITVSPEFEKHIDVIQLDLGKILQSKPDTKYVKVFIESKDKIEIKGIGLFNEEDMAAEQQAMQQNNASVG